MICFSYWRNFFENFYQDPDDGEDEEAEVKIDEKFLPEKKQRDISAEIKRKDHQRELAHQINEEARVSWHFLLSLSIILSSCTINNKIIVTKICFTLLISAQK